MLESFTFIWNVIWEFVDGFIGGLNNVLIKGNLKDLKTINISLRLLSDNAILETDIYTILIWLFMGIIFYHIVKILLKIINMPFKFFGL